MPGPLAAKVRAKYPGVYDDMDDAALERAVVAKHPEYQDLVQPAQAAPERTWTDTAVDALPSIGGALGGLVGAAAGPVGAIGGAALGGAGGEGFRQSIQTLRGKEAPRTTGGALRTMTQEGAMQGGAEGLGLGAGRLLSKVAEPIYNFGLGAAKRLRLEHPNLARTGLDELIAVSSRGTDKAVKLRGASASQADALISQAEQAGAGPVSTNQVVSGFKDVASDAGKRAQLGMADETADVAARARSIHTNNPGGIPLTQAQALKRTAQQSADTAFRTQERGGVIRGIDAQLDKSTAHGLRKGIEQAVPEVGPINQRTQALGGLSKALTDAETRNGIMSKLLLPTLAGVGTGLTTGDTKTGLSGAGLTAAITAPGNLSRMAIGLDRAGRYQIPANLLRAAIMAAMADQKK